jgi:hypothetical protein
MEIVGEYFTIQIVYFDKHYLLGGLESLLSKAQTFFVERLLVSNEDPLSCTNDDWKEFNP